MMPETDLSPGYRRAALTLHALGVHDQSWLLEQLPVQHRAALEALLGELRSLAIPADQTLIQSALQSATTSVTNGRALASVLEDEPAGLRDALLGLLPDAEAVAVQEAWSSMVDACPQPVPTSTWTPRLQQALRAAWRDLAAERGASA